MFIQSILSKLWITRLGSLAIKSAISTKSNGAITPNEKLLGRRRTLFGLNVRNCSKLTTVHDFSALFSNWHFHPKSRDEISFRGKNCNTRILRPLARILRAWSFYFHNLVIWTPQSLNRKYHSLSLPHSHSLPLPLPPSPPSRALPLP